MVRIVILCMAGMLMFGSSQSLRADEVAAKGLPNPWQLLPETSVKEVLAKGAMVVSVVQSEMQPLSVTIYLQHGKDLYKCGDMVSPLMVREHRDYALGNYQCAVVRHEGE